MTIILVFRMIGRGATWLLLPFPKFKHSIQKAGRETHMKIAYSFRKKRNLT